jgi:adenylate cyclase
VIGRAVDEASRVETLTKEVGRLLLITAPIAKLLDREMEAKGAYSQKGVETPVEVFAPAGGHTVSLG